MAKPSTFLTRFIFCISLGILLRQQLLQAVSFFSTNLATQSILAVHAPMTNPFISTIQLIARQDNFVPSGEQSRPNRPIGFASIFLTIHNPIEADQTLMIQSVKVVNAKSNQVELIQEASQSITLRPLENTVIDIQLTNQTGYRQRGSVKAIATYSVDGTVYQSISEAVKVN